MKGGNSKREVKGRNSKREKKVPSKVTFDLLALFVRCETFQKGE